MQLKVATVAQYGCMDGEVDDRSAGATLKTPKI